VALDRESITRRDFPAARRGYEPAAVDRHLAALADEVEELRRRSTPGGALAGQTSEQVRTIIEAAEASAAGIREGATTEAREHVARVAAAADGLRARIDALEGDLTGVIGALRTGAERLRGDLDGLLDATGRLAAAEPAPAPPADVAPAVLGATLGETAAAADRVEEEEVGEEPALAAVEEATEGGVALVGRSTDAVAARIVALQWAMDGRPREETDGYLAEHYDLPDRAALLEQVYAIAPKG
jgi:cell division septum initiation protein DivIVA